MHRVRGSAIFLVVLATAGCVSVSRPTTMAVDGDGPPRRLPLMTKDPQAEAYYDFAAAQMLVHAGRFREAVPLLQDALKRDPDSAFLWMQLAQWLVRADQPADALVAARKAVQLAPDEIQPHLLDHHARDVLPVTIALGIRHADVCGYGEEAGQGENGYE